MTGAVLQFVCRKCRHAHTVWQARCSSCRSLEGLTPETVTGLDMLRPQLSIVAPPPHEEPAEEDVLTSAVPHDEFMPIPLADVEETEYARNITGIAALDAVLGGGYVCASVVLLTALPGCGKSTLTLQMLDGLGHRCLYVSGEETRAQVAMTARRIDAASKKIYVINETSIEKIFQHARAVRAQTIAIDSIQKMRCEDIDGRANTPGQLKECTARLTAFAKSTGTSLWIIGHVTTDGTVAGPKTIEHDVDVVLELTVGERHEGRERLLIASKNRFGDTSVVGRLELTAKGIAPIDEDGWDEPL